MVGKFYNRKKAGTKGSRRQQYSHSTHRWELHTYNLPKSWTELYMYLKSILGRVSGQQEPTCPAPSYASTCGPPCTCVSADLDPSRFWIPYDVTHCLGMRSSLKCRKVTYKMCVAHPRKWIRFLLAGTVLADLDGQKLRFCERRLNLRG